MATALRRKMTYADLAKLPPDRNRHEILEGEWYMSPSPTLDHQTVVGNLYRILIAFAKARDLGKLWGASVDVILARHIVVVPDLVFISKPRLAIAKKKNVCGAPDLVIEVSSPSTTAVDRGRKLQIYRKRGIREYWIVDLFARVVEIHEFGRRPRVRIHKEGQVFQSDLFPGLDIAVDDVFES